MASVLHLDFATLGVPDGAEVVNDVVMGGVSHARLSASKEGLVFEGVVSPENGGGFASFRFPVAVAGRAARVTVDARGEGQRCKLVLRRRADGFQYHAGLVAARDARPTSFGPAAFAPSHRGRPVVAPPIDFATVEQAGLLISERQYGPFRIVLRSLAFEA